MQRTDLDAVLAIEERAFPQPWSRSFFEKELAAPQAYCTVAVRGEDGHAELVGYAVCWRVLDEVHLLNVAVHLNHRGSAIGRRLVEHVRERPCDRRAGRLPRSAGRQRVGAPALPAIGLPRPGRPARVLRTWSGRHRHGAPPRRRAMTGGVDLAVAIGAVTLPTPVIAASGTFGYGTEFAGLVDLGAIGDQRRGSLPLRREENRPGSSSRRRDAECDRPRTSASRRSRERLPALRAAGAGRRELLGRQRRGVRRLR
jgi:GNAT superfamily N-acetyltransferase